MSTENVLIIACGALAYDLVRIKNLNRWDHIDVQCLPAELHNTPKFIPQAVQEKIRDFREHYPHIFVAYSDCGTGGMLDKVLEEEGVERLPGAHCYEMFAGTPKFEQMHEAEPGCFYLTDFLARNFERIMIKGLGMDRHPELKQQYFANYRKLIYLVQREDPKIEANARDAAKFLGLEYERVVTGDNELQQSLKVNVIPSKRNQPSAPSPA